MDNNLFFIYVYLLLLSLSLQQLFVSFLKLHSRTHGRKEDKVKDVSKICFEVEVYTFVQVNVA